MVWLLFKALVNTICLPKNPAKGGKPINENIVIIRHKANAGFIEK